MNVALDAGMIRPWRTRSPSVRTSAGAVTGPVAGSRSPARTGGRRGRSGCRRTGSSGRPAPSTCVARFTNARAAPGVIRTRSSSSGSGSSKSSSTWSGETTAASVNGKTSITTRASSGSHDRVIVPARNSSSIGCSSGSSSSRPSGATAGITASFSLAGHHLVEQLVDPLGQGRHLLLLQRDAHQARAARGPAGRRCAGRACRRSR